MFRFSAEVFVLLALANPLVAPSDAFVIQRQQQYSQRHHRQEKSVVSSHQRRPFQLYATGTPQPPDTPPPPAYFAQVDESTVEEADEDTAPPEPEAKAAKTTPPPPPPPMPEPEPILSEEDLEKIQQFGSDLGSNAVEFIIKPIADIQKGVAPERIKGAALTGAFLGILASKGIVVSSVASLSAAYLAISRGVAGDVFRTVGGIAWDVTDSALRLLSIVANNEKLSMLPKGLAQRTMQALQDTQESARYLQMADSAEADAAAAEQAFLDSQEDLARVLEEAEAVIGEADDAIAKAQALEDKMVEEEDIDVSIPHDAAAQLAYERTDKSVPFATFKTQFVADAVDLVKSKQASRVQEREEAARIKAEEEELARIKAEEEEAAMGDEDFLAAVEMAQEGLEGKIVGVEEAIADSTGKAEWDAAGSLAAELRQDDDEEFDDDDDDFLLDDVEFEELDMEALGKAAREAVEMFDEDKVSPGQAYHAFEEASAAYSSMTVAMLRTELEGRGLPTGGKKADLIERLAADDAVGDEDDEDYFAEGLDMAALGKAAREAVEVANDDDNVGITTDEFDEDYEYWSSKTVAELKEELQERDLPTSGKKADLVNRIVEDAMTISEEVDDEDFQDDDITGFDLEELGRQAREAVQMFQTGAGDFDEEPTEEMLAELENEMTINGAFEDEAKADFTGMTVAQLKDECRSRGLKVGGKKAELIERLQEAA